ncbi:FN3 associated domain-containing protein [Flavobacterium pectinovorum]|uniref:FN3 associated domain-containing protein n=1 Tax=Flavobacterium pectinovorum TaxID=29533 RepID=UPI001FAD3064|nr:FN3 associated domain-containing protein [Flavobacterium pectinovorum]MCI9843674.1 chitobiase/beta-hexosaminidase C-terminal domain-containing protein [Flavobacterium pectinovorum]
MKLLLKKTLFLGLFVYLSFSSIAKAQTFKDDIMFQAFGWDVHTQSSVSAEGGLYNYLNARASGYAAAGFTVLWMPPPSKSTGGVGYIPTELFNFSQTVYGSELQLTTLLNTLNGSTPKIHPMADIVVNHRGGSTNWTDFTNPTWDCHSITSTDEANTVAITGVRPCGNPDTGEDFGAARDLDHTNAQVQTGVKEYLSRLKALGFDSWRWDVAKGFSANYFGDYIAASAPYASVGEYWDGDVSKLKSWVDGTGKRSTAFDFALYYKLSAALNGNYSQIAANPGLAGQFGYASLAVTFVDNHDTFVKTEWIGGVNIMKGYAYILTHPGIPCVFFPHYYGGTYTKDGVTRTYSANESAINKLMAIRKANGINANSSVVVSNSGSFYSATIDDKVAVRIGAGSWTPSGTGWNEAASGTDYKVWSKTVANTAPVVAITPAGGSFVEGSTVSVTIAATDDKVGSVIYYTTDGSTPTISSPVYTAAISIKSNATVKAIAKDVDGLLSGVVSQTYTFLPLGNITIQFLPPSSWTAPINIYHWNAVPKANLADAAWPGKVMTGPNSSGYYTYTFTNIASTNIIFNRGTGTPQTADIIGVNKSTCYNMSTGTLVEETCANLGVGQIDIESSKVILYPNPVLSSFKINVEVSEVYIYDISGRIVKEFKGSFDKDASFEITNLVNGMYFVSTKTIDGKRSTLPIVKK